MSVADLPAASPAPSAGWTASTVLRHVLGLDKARLTLATLLASGHQVGEALVPVVVGLAIDSAIETGDGSGLAWSIAVLALVFVGLSYSYRYFARVVVRAIENAAHDLRERLAAHILDPRSPQHGQRSGSLLRISSTDASGAAEVLTTLPTLMSAIAALVVTIVALFSVSFELGLLVVVGSVPVLVVMHLLGRPLQKRVYADQEASAEVAGVAADLVRGLRVVKGLGAEQAASERYRRSSARSLEASMRSAWFEAGFTGVSVLVTGVFLAVVALVAGRQAANGSISIGALISAVGLAQFLIGPLERLIATSAQFAHARAAAERVATVLSSEPAVDGEERLDLAGERGAGHLVIDGVDFGSLRGVSLEARPGELLGVAALDATDARSMMGMLARDGDPSAGEIRLDGASLDKAVPSDVHGAVLVAAHDADLFDGSVLDNISVRSASACGTEAAMAAAAVDEMAEALPSGLGTRIGEKGHALSGGQRQRVALARAIAADPPVLVLHDPTSAVDTVTEAAIAAAVRAVRSGRTTLLVATSPTLLAGCDRVVVLIDGKAVATGTHPELVQERPDYREAVLG